MDKPSGLRPSGLGGGAGSLGDWCPLFRDSVMTSTSVAEKFNADSSFGFWILEYETIAQYQNVRFQSPVTKRHIPSRKDGDLNCIAAKARNPQNSKANR